MPWPGEWSVESGAYAVQPADAGPPFAKKLRYMTTPPSRYSQYESAFRRGNAMSRAPIISGTRKLPKPARIGTTTRKIIVVPWIVTTWLYEFFVRKLSFGVASWARMSSASTPPSAKKISAVQM